MIDDLDKTLGALLKRELPPSLLKQVAICFEAPDDQFPPSSVTPPAIDLFLYDVRENNELRSNEWSVERGDGRFEKRRAPVRVDCSYVITTWARASSNQSAQDEHRLLGEVMRVLLRYPTLPSEVLQGSLTGQEPSLPAVSLQPGRLQSLGEFWQALGGKPKAALYYTVTIGVDPFEPVEGPLVKVKELDMNLGLEKKDKNVRVTP